ncbi:hypothetical protein [Serinicoccus sediminis]|uniref:hypothetical protein n=1 Tax=Serinicoccus sediminis TaxID=2306021 RepID=UPI001020A221|nr:hypothetical protein [Serinicoccus sediminis]
MTTNLSESPSQQQQLVLAVKAAQRSLALLVPRVRESVQRFARGARALAADMDGKHDLATVIRQQPGRQIVRDGLADVRHWTHDCGCYDRDPRERGWCSPAWDRVDAAVLALAVSSPLSIRALRQLAIDFLELPVVEHVAQHEDVVGVGVAWLRTAEALTVCSVPVDVARRLGGEES